MKTRPRWAGCWLVILGMAGLGGMSYAAEPTQPLPFQAYRDFVQQVHAQWYVPQAAGFEAQGQQLIARVQALCDAAPAAETAALSQARQQWLQTVDSWARFSAVRGGALLARRSPREIDFMPPRPPAIERAVQSAPADARAMESIGSPAKGLPALEWLLWNQPMRAGSPECRYAQQVARAIHAEALALQQAYALALANGWDDPQAEYAMYEFLNLWDAGLQKLWWEDMERPSRKGLPGRKPVFARSASGHTVSGWHKQWQGLRQLAIGSTQGNGTLQAYLLAQGHPEEAARLVKTVAAVDQAMARLQGPADNLPGDRLEDALAALKALQQFAETDLAAALHFVISFFDEDGD